MSIIGELNYSLYLLMKNMIVGSFIDRYNLCLKLFKNFDIKDAKSLELT